jgi:ERG8-type phosphomevalonate kinase
MKLASLGLSRTLASLNQIPPFVPTGVNLSEVHKTGLGSSAALITSLVIALLVHLSVIPSSALAEDQSEGRRLAHNLAQYVHCLAQGKVGSGFDVSAAVFGSHIYTRFDPSVLQKLMTDEAVSYLHRVTKLPHDERGKPVPIAASPAHYLARKRGVELPRATFPTSATHQDDAGRCGCWQ